MREFLHIDITKLKEEDRRFLLSKSSSEYIFNEQSLLNNRILFISIFAVLVSLASFIMGTDYISTNVKSFIITLFILAIIYLTYSFFKNLINIRKEQKILEEGYNKLFKLHLKYKNPK